MTERRHPDWIKVRAPTSPEYFRTKALLAELRLHTVCQEACCPNIGECFSHRTATFMLMGDVCTRNCPYCAVAHGKVRPLDPDEPRRIAEAVARLGLDHVVVTSVDRDDLPDGGASHFAATAGAIQRLRPATRVEVLVPDFKGSYPAVETVVGAPVAIFNHNIETVPSLYRKARPGGNYQRSLDVLAHAKSFGKTFGRADGRALLTKAGIMLGLGEEPDEVETVLRDLRAAGCDILTLGQYLRPSRDHLPVERYVTPAEFAELKSGAMAMGFRHVESGPLVRSSYHAWEHVN
ncbi:MAG: lipoyl synthase [Candidatus Binataceae bacterium]